MIPAQNVQINAAAVTHPGMKGKNNEDRYGISVFYTDPQQRIPSVLAIVSDGIGGHRAGEVASKIAVDTIENVVGDSDGSTPEATLQDAVIKASEAIRQQAESDPAQKGMGATCVIAWIISDRLYSATVGDSRLYLIRDQAIRKLSTDHTWVQEAIDHGALTPEQARNHPNAHVIRRYLGSQQPAVPDLRLRLFKEETDTQAEANQGTPLLVGDTLLLCSDGLTDLVDDEEILEQVEGANLEKAVNKLKDMANERGGHDNITIIAMRMPIVGGEQTLMVSKPAAPAVAAEDLGATRPLPRIRPEAIQAAKAAPETRSRPWFILLGAGCLVLIMLALLGVGLAWGLNWYTSQQPTLQLTQAVPTTNVTVPAILTTGTATPTATPTPTPTPTETPPKKGPVGPVLRATYTPWVAVPATVTPSLDTPGSPIITFPPP